MRRLASYAIWRHQKPPPPYRRRPFNAAAAIYGRAQRYRAGGRFAMRKIIFPDIYCVDLLDSKGKSYTLTNCSKCMRRDQGANVLLSYTYSPVNNVVIIVAFIKLKLNPCINLRVFVHVYPTGLFFKWNNLIRATVEQKLIFEKQIFLISRRACHGDNSDDTNEKHLPLASVDVAWTTSTVNAPLIWPRTSFGSFSFDA